MFKRYGIREALIFTDCSCLGNAKDFKSMTLFYNKKVGTKCKATIIEVFYSFRLGARHCQMYY